MPLSSLNALSGDFDSQIRHGVNKLLVADLVGRTTEVGESLAGHIFPDAAFGFAINDQFGINFYGSFLSEWGTRELTRATTFLNRMISTIALYFLRATQDGSPSNPCVTSRQHNRSLMGHAINRNSISCSHVSLTVAFGMEHHVGMNPLAKRTHRFGCHKRSKVTRLLDILLPA
jgi:hypothetical protein